MEKAVSDPWRPDQVLFRPPETPLEPMEFLSRSWSVLALEISKALAPPQMLLSKPSNGESAAAAIPEDLADELEEGATCSGNPFSFASSETSLSWKDWHNHRRGKYNLLEKYQHLRGSDNAEPPSKTVHLIEDRIQFLLF